MLTPCEILERRRLVKDVHLENSPDVYETLADLVARPETVESPPSGYLPELSLIWENNPQADKKVFTADVKGGKSVMKVLQTIAAGRGEHLTMAGNYVAITSSPKASLPTYQMQDIDPSTNLKDAMQVLIPISITIRAPEDDVLDILLSHWLKSTLRSTKDPSTFRFVTSDRARRKAAPINVLGNWFYHDLFEALGMMANLRWSIEGSTVYLRDADEK